MLGIFQGKKAKLNELILKSLVVDSKTAKQIAEYIYHNQEAAIKPKGLDKNRVKSIEAEITRRTEKQKGRIYELETKHYIERKENLWNLTVKGFPVALTLLDNAVGVWPYVKKEDLTGFMKALHEIPIIDNFLSDKRLKKIENFGMSVQFLERMREATKTLIDQGVDVDNMSEREFNVHLSSKLAYSIGMELLNLNISEIFDDYQKRNKP